MNPFLVISLNMNLIESQLDTTLMFLRLLPGTFQRINSDEQLQVKVLMSKEATGLKARANEKQDSKILSP